jgi:leucyl/phenylalanyl-tRNA--protein transferase
MSGLLDPRLMLQGYASGVFPMADARDNDELYWVEPRTRAILPLEGFHVSRSLAKRIRSDCYRVTADEAFGQVLLGCADRPETWINRPIEQAMHSLFELGFAHSIEVWEGERLVGGVYGVALGRAFFGESMFSRRVDASKIALAFLVARLRLGHFTLLDCQFMTPHLASLGAIDIPRRAYVARLNQALARNDQASPPSWRALDELPSSSSGSACSGAPGKAIVQLLGQTS